MNEQTTGDENPKPRRFNRIRVYYRLHRKRLIAGFVVLAHTAGALTSVEAIMETRTPQGAVAWAISLNLFPYGAVPAYWAFGHTDFEDYDAALRESNRKLQPIREEVAEAINTSGLVAPAGDSLGKILANLSEFGFTTGNDVTLLVDGEETYDSMLEAIGSAEKYILFQTYILRSDATGKKFGDALIAKAKEGVKVRVLYDQIGSLGLDDSYVRELTDAGIEASVFSTNHSDGRKYQLNYRNHRKILVVDGETGFTGGLNIGDEHLGKDEVLTPWRDTHIRVTGPAAVMLQFPFAEDWYWATRAVPGELDWSPGPAAEGTGSTVLCLPTGPADERETCGLFFLAAINSAEKRLWIATPYFVPDTQIVSALKLAALRGVDVRLIVPDLNDSKLVHYSSHAYLDEVERAGIRTYRYGKGFLHQKSMLIDDDISCIGSANMDNRSFRLNFEVMMVVRDQSFATETAAMFEDDFASSREIEPGELAAKPFHFRLASKVSRLLAPIQ